MSGLITNYVAPKPPARFKDAIDELIKAGPGAAYAITGKTPAEGVRGSITGDVAAFQRAAGEAGYSAVVTEKEDMGDGTSRRVFVLTDKRTRTVKPKGEVADKPAK